MHIIVNHHFKYLLSIYYISDPEKRKIYDQTGETSDDATATGDFNWQEYFDLIIKVCMFFME